MTDYENAESIEDNSNKDPEDTDLKNEVMTNKEDVIIEVHCDNDDASGHYVFVRDDRKKNEFFSLCEVEVFSDNKKCT